MFLFILWTPANSSSELSHYIQYTFAARTVTSYLNDANLTSLSLRWSSRFALNRLVSPARLKFPPLISELIWVIMFWVASQYWQLSILALRKLKVSCKFCWNISLNMEMLTTGPLFLIFERLALKLGCFAQKSCHILLIDTLQSKYFLWVFARL